MELYRRKKLEFVVNKSALPRLLSIFDRHQVDGHSQLTVVGGQGTHGQHYPSTLISVYDSIMIVAVLSEDKVKLVVDESEELLAEQGGVMFLSDVEVLRPERY